MSCNQLRQRGLSLIEVLIFIVIVSVGLVGLLSVFNVSVRHSGDPLLQVQMLTTAESLLEEILLKDYSNPADGFTRTSAACDQYRVERAFYDDVRDYDGITDCPIHDLADNSAIAALAAYRISAQVENATLGSVAALKVTVSVSAGGRTVALQGYRTNYGG